ncbi:thiolase C-terminal domain-containing protein [Mycolicibacterium sp. SCSIO 43805]|uniref:thiolase C-terminal domain-containing protein n=1 Tax=Mycolicibacterium sp. SCSIO 43805 TaxID=3378074 RepID=UPI003AB4B25D
MSSPTGPIHWRSGSPRRRRARLPTPSPASDRSARGLRQFTVNVLRQIEAAGFCKPGEAADFVLDGCIAADGLLPTNLNGGLLSELEGMKIWSRRCGNCAGA